MTSSTTRTRRRRYFLPIALAAVGVLGIGAAVTTAAWTDQVWFAAEAKAADFNLQGSLLEAGPFDEYESQGTALAIPISTSNFGDLVPSDTARTLDVYVKNAGTVDATLSLTSSGTGALFTTAGSTVTVSAIASDTDLAPGEVTKVTITLTPGQMPAALENTSGTVLVTVTGSTD